MHTHALLLRFVTGQSAGRDQLLAPERSLWQPIDHPAGWVALAQCLMMLPLGDARARTCAARRKHMPERLLPEIA